MLSEAVRLRMRADVPVGCYLSGGVDSSSVLGLAATFAESPMTAFTIAFDHDDFNENESSRLTAEFVGANYHPVPVNAADFAEDFEEAVRRGEMIHYNAHGPARFRLSRNVRDAGYKVVLACSNTLRQNLAFSATLLLRTSLAGFKVATRTANFSGSSIIARRSTVANRLSKYCICG
ncbi:MAG: asparagine synthase C-terminal domain-containing protein [Chloracidobacterium sp.]|nr:asparagine synthase C-terminal domain-containing protein [Chloracidobacterium sp.]